MVRLSDILKDKIQSAQKPDNKALPSGLAGQKAKAMPQEQSRQQKPQEMQIVKAMKEVQPDMGRSKALYGKGIQLIKEFEKLLIESDENNLIDVSSIKEVVEKVVNCSVLGDETLFQLFYEDYSPEGYPYNHMMNVMIISVGLGLRLGYNKSQLNMIGLAAILHDGGMFKLKKLVSKPDVLSKQEYEQVKQHPVDSANILSLVKDIMEEVTSAVREHHERVDKSGYPDGQGNAEISQYARIISITDVYEALTHSRSYRKKYSPHEALRKLLTVDTSSFDKKILKILVNHIGIYPIGSWVSLNSNEIARVVTANDNLPLRPVVNIIFNTAKKRLPEPRLLNLAKQPNLYIKRPLADKDVAGLVKE